RGDPRLHLAGERALAGEGTDHLAGGEVDVLGLHFAGLHVAVLGEGVPDHVGPADQLEGVLPGVVAPLVRVAPRLARPSLVRELQDPPGGDGRDADDSIWTALHAAAPDADRPRGPGVQLEPAALRAQVDGEHRLQATRAALRGPLQRHRPVLHRVAVEIALRLLVDGPARKVLGEL